MAEAPPYELMERYRREALEYANRATLPPPIKEDELPMGSTVTPEEAPLSDADDYAQFLREHPSEGTLKIQATAARTAFPVSDATVEVSVILNGEKYVLYNNVTDQSGISDDMLLPSLPSAFSQSSSTASDSGTRYEVSIFHPAFRELIVPVTIYDSIKTILPVVLQPVTSYERGER